MIFVPLLHYFKCKNSYSGNEYGLRYRMIPGKRTVPDPDGGEVYDRNGELLVRSIASDRKSTRLNSSHRSLSRMPSSA